MSYLNLTNIRSEIKSNIHFTALSNTKIDRWVNLTQDMIARKMDSDHLEETTTFSTVTSQRTYNVRMDLLKVKSVIDQTGDYELNEVSESAIEGFDPGLDDTGSPTDYSVYGVSEVLNQPSSASVITLTSSSGSDTSQTVRVTGLVSGIEDSDVLTIPGATTKQFTRLYSIRKSAISVGSFTATSNATTVTNVVIPANRLVMQYQPINLYPIPTDVRTMLVRYIRVPRPMINGEDMPDLPEVYHEIILIGVAMKAHENMYEFARAKELREFLFNEIEGLRQNQGNTRNNTRIIKPRTPTAKVLGRYPSNF